MIKLISVIISLILLVLYNFAADVKTYHGGVQKLNDNQQQTLKEYRNLKLPTHKISFNEFCFPDKFKLQAPQKFCAKWMAPETKNMNLLGFHQIGSGKTCSIIQICKQYIGHGKPLVIMPASLIGNFLAEMRGPCGNYVNKIDAEKLNILHPKNPEYKEIITTSNNLIYQNYDIMSYNKFAQECDNLHPPLLVIDEVHNVTNPSGVYYQKIIKFISKHPRIKVVAMSATPIFDNSIELIYLMKILRQNLSENDLLEKNILKSKLNGLISYYAGAPAKVFPAAHIHYEICAMSRFQSKWFISEQEAEFYSNDIKLQGVTNNFYAKSRIRSNIVFPQGLAPSYGIAKLSKNIIKDHLETYSIKFAKLLRKLKKNQLSFVYTNFTNLGGIKTIIKCLKTHGWSDYRTNGDGKKYAIFSGEETPTEKDAIRKLYNSSENDDGSIIQVIIGSPATREGISFLRCRQVHIIDPYWNYSRLAQIIGRAVRTCSHKTLARVDRTVDIYFYISTTYNSKINKNNFAKLTKINPNESVDGYIIKLAEEKRQKNNNIIKILIDSAVDKGLNQDN